MKTALTIGFFDGVHLGHQALLKRLRAYPHATILTFSNHPQSLFKPPAPQQIISLEEKLTLLKAYADEVISLPFTPEFAQTSFEELLSRFDLSAIVLGTGSVFGKNREGSEERVREYAAKHGIEIHYIPKTLFDGEPVSSSRIRKAFAEGNINLAHQLLGKS